MTGPAKRPTMASRMDLVCDVLADRPNRTAAQVAVRAGLGSSSAERYLRMLERLGRVSSRIETVAEAEHRVASTARSVFTRRCARRTLRWVLSDAHEGVVS